MPASIALSGLAYAPPGASPLFSGLELVFGPERCGLVGRNGAGKSTLLRLIAGELAPSRGVIRRTGRIGVLRQDIGVRDGETIADLFGVRDALALLARADAGGANADELSTLDWTAPQRLHQALQHARLEVGADARLATLSGGQRTRAGLAALLFDAPDFLLLDEPTNNLDATSRNAMLEMLAAWRGGAIVASHDRDLLERMDAIVELTSLGVARTGGGWSDYVAARNRERAAAARTVADAEKRLDSIDARAQAVAERKARKDGAGARKARRGDAPKLLSGMKKRRAEETGAAQTKLAERRRDAAKEDLVAARARVEVLEPFAVATPSTHLPAQKTVLSAEKVGFAYAPDKTIIRDLSFSVTGPERILIEGDNGAGKSTLLHLIAGLLAPQSGTMRVHTGLVLLDQHVSMLDGALTVLDNFRRLNPDVDLNASRAALARFLFRGDAALKRVDALSGGERMRAGLAAVLAGAPPLLLLDEPTNHLDLDSIEAIEAGLATFDGAILVASHDRAFVDAIGITRRLALGVR